MLPGRANAVLAISCCYMYTTSTCSNTRQHCTKQIRGPAREAMAHCMRLFKIHHIVWCFVSSCLRWLTWHAGLQTLQRPQPSLPAACTPDIAAPPPSAWLLPVLSSSWLLPDSMPQAVDNSGAGSTADLALIATRQGNEETFTVAGPTSTVVTTICRQLSRHL